MTYQRLVGYKGGEVLRELLADYGVKHVFGYPGGAALPLFDGIYETSLFQFILSRHEQGASHMAEGYARASGKPGVVMVTSGPGTSNTVTGMLDALLDGTPMVIICGQVATTVQGTGAFQEIEVIPLAQACTKWCTCVESVSKLPGAIDSAFRYATEKRPGPVLIAVPKDVSSAIFDAAAFEESLKITDTTQVSRGSYTSLARWVVDVNEQLEHVANIINQSERPVICAGNGVNNISHGSSMLKKIVKKTSIPVATTLLGIGCFDETHDLALHMTGTYGTPYANRTIQNADTILAIGARLDERATGKAAGFAPRARNIIHLDINPDTVGKVIKPTELIIGNISMTLPSLITRLKKGRDRSEWLSQVQDWKSQYCLGVPSAKEKQQHVLPQKIVAELSRCTESTKHRTIITTGTGQHQMWMAQRYRFKRPRSLITSGSLGTMGYGLPSAIGAQLAKPDHLVIDVDGDASLCMTMAELLTASQNNIPVKVVIFNNDQQAMIAQLQHSDYNGRLCHTKQASPDFVQLAQSMKCQGRQCTSREKLGDCIDWLIGCQGPAVLDVLTADTDMRPIVPTDSTN
ncbi:acetolactate synthase [Aspergillus avenaceus]|uniref:Acetolactate synthase n=1 Tax=Aspergillus avenaceus TaxID=36643 RepID=A0A5N6TLK7_ASPAV|nr:acetolactate synthase [Aspergillus avenaceus]